MSGSKSPRCGYNPALQCIHTLTGQALLSRNARVYIAARNQEKAEAAIEHLRGVTRKEAFFLKLDLASLQAVKSAAEEFLRCVSVAVKLAERSSYPRG